MITKQQLTTQLATLVSMKTLTGDIETNRTALDYIQTLISKNAVIKRVQNNTAEILLAGNKSNSELLNPEIGYMVHVDIVAAEEKLFTMSVTDSIAKGRGVSDMKYSIPIGVALLNELIEKNSSKSFTLAITTDEEVGGFNGALFLAKEMKFRPKVLIVPDGGDNLIFVNKSKGVLQLRLTCSGTAAHSSQPWEGKSAIVPLCEIITKLAKKYQKNSLKKNWNTTLNFGKINGGISTNQVCPQATLDLDFRFPETTTMDALFADTKRIIDSVDPTISIEKLSTGQTTFTDKNLPIVKKFIRSMESAVQQKIKILPTYGASDARHFTDYKIPVLMIKPIGGDIHQSTEWINLDSCIQFSNGLRNFLEIK